MPGKRRRSPRSMPSTRSCSALTDAVWQNEPKVARGSTRKYFWSVFGATAMISILIEVQTGSYLGEDDIVRIEDDYHRS
jgi:hypothetical protein